MENLGEAKVDIVLDLGKFQSQLKKVEKSTRSTATRMAASFDRVGKALGRVGRGMSTRVTLPMLAVGGAAAKTASDFDTSLTKIISLVGVAEGQVKSWKQEILDMAPAVGKGPGELAEALFFVTSAGARGATAMDILEKSAKAASAGLGNASTVADAATSAMNAYGESNVNAGKAVGILVGTVREGKASAESIAGALGQVLAISSELGVSFDQVGASVAALTRLGITADESVTALKSTLSALLNPTQQARDAMGDMGIDLKEMRNTLGESGGLLTVLEQLKGAVAGSDVEIATIFPNIRALTAVLSLVGNNAEQVKGIFAALAEDGVHTLDQAFEIAAKTSAFKFQVAMAKIGTTMTRLGDAILPAILPLIASMTTFLDDMTKKFTELNPETQMWIVAITGAVAALGPMLAVLGLVVIGLGGLAAAFLSLPAVIMAAVAGFVVFHKTLAGIAESTFGVFHKFMVVEFENKIIKPMFALINKAIEAGQQFGLFKDVEFLPINPDKDGPAVVKSLTTIFEEAKATALTETEDLKTLIVQSMMGLGERLKAIGAGEDGEGGYLQGLIDQFEQAKESFKAGIEDPAKTAATTLKETFKTAGASIKDDLESAITSSILNFESLKDVASNVLKIVLDEMMKVLVIKPLLDGLFSFIPGMGAGKAGGGDISGPTLVGERGPEIVSPKGPATVINGANTKNAMGGKNVNVTQNISMMSDVQNSVRAEIANAAPLIANAAANLVFESLSRRAA